MQADWHGSQALSPPSEETESSYSDRVNCGFGSSEINAQCGRDNSTHPEQRKLTFRRVFLD